ncbi:MAG: dTDP-4-dehydrorhamnose 3,5-epimerase [Anaerolineae bacterium]|jgi:dTDP-4-dehydrorhamnose 3,5-epimerase|nr:dTDP-4-dehydrorhamnose 3,5-epimerase [Anaerolineae bacterium]MBT4456928.1 dTDP-4-dehydrorhamnose 3,5-epimerase [Anaerolineae bacterium]MBT4843684.1 dTDP-4-dehydrorhamnose 3,5-epimerase [Anaerolineae bacterium]MBT6060324.1 dTDP-4-dehydrorhamnose 3,5-epimerase [Anaerolineae bacterium]MBT6323803.1 dTDP-4-dehydrorhamnose 3,5-epimerase [Anaerolineae bacterium]
MKFQPLTLQGCYEIQLDPHRDLRGYFTRTYDRQLFREYGLTTDWVQQNQSMTLRKWTLRGLHFQAPPHAETKLVRASLGTVLDVFVDLRIDSATYRQWEAVELSAEAFNMIYIPRGFAHGFCTLTDEAIVNYHVDARYASQAEGGVRWNDEFLNIPWPTKSPFVSDKDQALPYLREFESPFTLSDSIPTKQKENVHA